MNTLYKNPFRKALSTFTPNDDSSTVRMINTDSLFPNPSQPRFIFEDEPLLRLADSIRRYGILQPLSVRPIIKTEGAPPVYQIIAGERRWRAARIVGMTHVPCIILDIDNQKSAEFALIENIQREDLNVFEQAAAIASLIDIYGLTQEQAARQLSTSQSYIANKLRILRLTPKERTEIIKHKLTERHARALLRLSDPAERLEVIGHVAAKELNVNATEKYIDRIIEQKNAPEVPIRNQKTVAVLKDLRFFYNSVDKAVELLKGCGIDVSTQKSEKVGETSIVIKITHP